MASSVLELEDMVEDKWFALPIKKTDLGLSLVYMVHNLNLLSVFILVSNLINIFLLLLQQVN